MKRIEVSPAAEAEMIGAFEWYWMQSESAALGFDAEVRAALVALRQTPQVSLPYLLGTRRMLLKRYPFFVVFRESPPTIQIIAVAHMKRRPGYWKNRAESPSTP